MLPRTAEPERREVGLQYRSGRVWRPIRPGADRDTVVVAPPTGGPTTQGDPISVLVHLVRRHPLLAFAALACLFGWLPYVFVALGLGSNPENLPLGPAFAALVVTSCQGREALRAWGRSLRRWGASPWLYAVAVGAPIAMHVSIVLVNRLLGAPLPTGAQLAEWPDVPVRILWHLPLVISGDMSVVVWILGNAGSSSSSSS